MKTTFSGYLQCQKSVTRFNDSWNAVTSGRVLKAWDFAKVRTQTPVLIYEREQVGRRWFFFKRYANKLLFTGRLPVSGLLLLGREEAAKWVGGRFRKAMASELMELLSTAKLDDKPYQVVAFFTQRKHFVIYITTVLRRTPIIEHQA